MIKQYTDHSANERTYLAWIRTAIAIMAFGFLIEKFDIFIAQMRKVSPDGKHLETSLPVELAGLGILCVGIFMIACATIRFYMNKKNIESGEVVEFSARKSNMFLLGLMFFIALFLLIYMSSKVLPPYITG
jgi:putative membrane protein